jgi:hypothetical protein
MNDPDILAEIERRLNAHFDTPGYSEHNTGYTDVLEWIKELRMPTFGVQKHDGT